MCSYGEFGGCKFRTERSGSSEECLRDSGRAEQVSHKTPWVYYTLFYIVVEIELER